MPIACRAVFGIFFQVAFNVCGQFLVRLIDPEMALAQNVGIKGEKLFHGIRPVPHVGTEIGKKGPVYVLAEENTFCGFIYAGGN